jgi:hypothetical protein
MTTLKLTTWNVEHFNRLLTSGSASAAARRAAVVQEIDEIAPDVLCLVEAPGDLATLRAWVASASGLNARYHVATIPGTDAILQQGPANVRAALQDLYAMKGSDQSGNQWIWFLVRDGLYQASQAELLPPQVWRDLTGQQTWKVHAWGNNVPHRHQHWRHPQTLVLRLGSTAVEVIGVHLKSKINTLSPFDANGDLNKDYVVEAHRARANLTTEAYDVRRYIERRFEQEPNPRIFVCGDMNDGPGRDYFERTYLYFDLVSNVQGDVFFARRFLNHALFDFDDRLRWTTNFRDRVEAWSREQEGAESLPSEPVDPTRFQLLDHILFTQALVGEASLPRVEPHAGLVEHTIHQRVNATLSQANRTSDHVPVSVVITT